MLQYSYYYAVTNSISSLCRLIHVSFQTHIRNKCWPANDILDKHQPIVSFKTERPLPGVTVKATGAPDSLCAAIKTPRAYMGSHARRKPRTGEEGEETEQDSEQLAEERLSNSDEEEDN